MICLRLDFLFISYQFTIVSLYFIALYSSCISMDRWCQIFYPYRSIIPNSEVTVTSQNFFPRNQMKFQLRVKRMTNRRSSHPARSTKLRSFIVARTSHLASAHLESFAKALQKNRTWEETKIRYSRGEGKRKIKILRKRN